MEKPTIYISSDHGGFETKAVLSQWLYEQGYSVEDFGAHELDMSDDYPQYAILVASAIVDEKAGSAVGIVTCRSAGGVTIAANKVLGARAVAVFDKKSAIHAKEHNNANIITLSGDWVSTEQAKEIISSFLNANFSGEERHVRRLQQISEYEKSQKK